MLESQNKIFHYAEELASICRLSQRNPNISFVISNKRVNRSIRRERLGRFLREEFLQIWECVVSRDPF